METFLGSVRDPGIWEAFMEIGGNALAVGVSWGCLEGLGVMQGWWECSRGFGGHLRNHRDRLGI